MQFERKKIGEILVEIGAITPAEVKLILERMKANGRTFGLTGVEEGFFSRELLAQALAAQFQLEYLELDGFVPDQQLINSLPTGMPLRYRFLPISRTSEGLEIAIGDPTDVATRESIELLLDTPLILRVAVENKITRILERGEGSKRVLEEVSEDFKLQLVKETDKGEEVLSIEKLTADTSPIIRLIDSTLYDALIKRASDIHIESALDGVIIKYRIDGVLYRATEPLDSRFQSPIISRIKVMSELDISERRIPQDGRFKVRVGGKSIDFRVSIMPSIFGEDAVIRILDKETIASDLKGLTLEALGFTQRELSRFRRMIREPYGMVLVTGPTGSGKTTTLYGALSEIHNEEEKIITIEDPVEYQLKGVVQIPVNEKKGLTFARGLRSILRHDPDKIMVGEIRDPETAQIAVQSALTGHLVFTTVHANNVFDVLGRFLHMGIDPYNFVSCLNCVAAQRLVRKICSHCKRPIKYGREELEESGLDYEQYRDHTFYEGAGCDECNGMGYHGRSAIVELLDLNDDIRELIVSKASVVQLKRAAREAGTMFLRESAVEKVLMGISTLKEINRVTFVEKVV
ncbi:type II secretion system ATPase PulE [Desulfuromonas versatilis]|uniref:Type II secretion system ATPase PulE n=1 Tax=Desulfuromonas versatilis TaxID=2802975 RepID=A0ABM8HXD1_9BACT|nr:GspE/PulE family protein [Desulfuromonas versatilis]BCR05769.1 type II secretion system ATPase PulE [Desulfuromonas versatilis]